MESVENLHLELIERVAAREGLRVEASLPLVAVSTGAPVGKAEELSGGNLDKAVVSALALSDGMQPEWVSTFHAFARTMALVPHLLVEWRTSAGETHGSDEREGDDLRGDGTAHLVIDLLPRIDLAVNLDYVDEVYGPLSDVVASVSDLTGVDIVRVPPRRAVTMSPWCVSVTALQSALGDLVPVINAFVDRWLALNSGGVGSPVDPLASDQARLIQHDRFHRNALFDADSDPFWKRVDQLLGMDGAAELRMMLRSQRER